MMPAQWFGGLLGVLTNVFMLHKALAFGIMFDLFKFINKWPIFLLNWNDNYILLEYCFNKCWEQLL